MKRKIWAAVALAVLGVAVVTPAQAAQRTSVHPLSSKLATTDFWTPEAMRAATPLDGPLRTVSGALNRATSAIPSVGASNTGSSYTGGGKVSMTSGRVFFLFNGAKASCSGNAVRSGNSSVVITAGHCVKYQGTWHTDWVFVPGYNNGNAPYGKWTAKSTMTTPQWEAGEDLNYDVGAAVVNPLNGRRLTDVVGGQGIAFNQPRGQKMYDFGYPAESPFDGTKEIYCSGRTFSDVLTTKDNALRCNMNGGSSGGPWLMNFDPATGTGVQNSVNSFGYNFLPGFMFGPYFGSDVQALYQRAAAS